MDTLADAAATTESPVRSEAAVPGTPMHADAAMAALSSPRVPFSPNGDVKMFEVSLTALKTDIQAEEAAISKLDVEIQKGSLSAQEKRNLTSQKSRHRAKLATLNSQLAYAQECHRRRMLELHVHQLDLRLWELDFMLQRAMTENRYLKSGEKVPDLPTSIPMPPPVPSLGHAQPQMSPYAAASTTGLTPRFANMTSHFGAPSPSHHVS